MKTACHYAIVRFMPVVETEEFANVGVVLCEPGGRYFGFRLLGHRSSRVTNFFEKIEGATFRGFMRDLQEELERVSAAFKKLDKKTTSTMWSEVIKPRASMVRFGEGRVVLASDPEEKLNELFEYYVGQRFVSGVA